MTEQTTTAQTTTFEKGAAITYLGSMWTEPAQGYVVRDNGGPKVAIHVRKPYFDPYGEWVSLKVRRTSISAQ